MFGVRVLIQEVTIRTNETFSVKSPDGREIFIMYEKGDFTFCPEGVEFQDVAYALEDGTWRIKEDERKKQ